MQGIRHEEVTFKNYGLLIPAMSAVVKTGRDHFMSEIIEFDKHKDMQLKTDA